MTRRILDLGMVALGAVLAAVLVASVFLALNAPEDTGGDPTDAPSGERANPCAPDDQACNEWLEVQEGDR